MQGRHAVPVASMNCIIETTSTHEPFYTGIVV